MRGAPADWDGLAARGNPGWSWADVLPAYLAIEDHSLGAGGSRGTGGPLGVSVTDPGDEVTAAIMASAVGYGWERVADANASDAERIGFTPSTISRGRRTTSYDALRPPGARPPGRGPARSRWSRRAHRRHPHPRRPVALRRSPRRRGRRRSTARARAGEVTARREVILCAGSVETPLLLERSGIGRPQLLEQARHRRLSPSRRTSVSASSSSAASPSR